MGECHGYLKTILTGLYDYNNLYCVSVEEKIAIEDPSVNTFMKSICDKKCGNYSVESANFMDRPLILPPLLNVQSEISRHKDKEKFDYVPYKYLYLFNEPRTARLTLEGQDEDAAPIVCPITSHNDKLLIVSGKHYFAVKTPIRRYGSHAQPGLRVSARIVVSDKTLWQQIFKK